MPNFFSLCMSTNLNAKLLMPLSSSDTMNSQYKLCLKASLTLSLPNDYCRYRLKYIGLGFYRYCKLQVVTIMFIFSNAYLIL